MLIMLSKACVYELYWKLPVLIWQRAIATLIMQFKVSLTGFKAWNEKKARSVLETHICELWKAHIDFAKWKCVCFGLLIQNNVGPELCFLQESTNHSIQTVRWTIATKMLHYITHQCFFCYFSVLFFYILLSKCWFYVYINSECGTVVLYTSLLRSFETDRFEIFWAIIPRIGWTVSGKKALIYSRITVAIHLHVGNLSNITQIITAILLRMTADSMWILYQVKTR